MTMAQRSSWRRGLRAMACAAAASAALFASPTMSVAEHIEGGTEWSVRYADGRMSSNWSEDGAVSEIRQLEPGDDVTLHVTLSHDNAELADWYVSNEVLKSLEEGDATGSGYGYVLSYSKPDGQVREIYRSANVGGTGTQGLVDATKSLDGFFFLDTLSKGQTGRLDLTVSLDGETEQNAYFNRFARIRLAFAVDPARRGEMVQTGAAMPGIPTSLASLAAGSVLLALAAATRRMASAAEEGAER